MRKREAAAVKAGAGSASRLADTSDGYGWISIVLHWAGALAIVVLLFAGSSIHGRKGDYQARLDMHTSLAVCAWLFLWLRIAWRFVKGHPGPLPSQGKVSFALAAPLHLMMLAAVAVMLVSGPLMAWAAGAPIRVFALAIPAPYGPDPGLWETMRSVHVGASTFIAITVLLHIAAAIANAAFKRDGGFDKIMVPARPVQSREDGNGQ